MKKLTLRLLTFSLFVAGFLFVAGLTLWAADVWVAKPYTDWNDKDLAKIMTDSPWARKVSVTLTPGGGGGGPAAGGGGGRGSRSGPQGDSVDPGGDVGGGGGRGGGRGGGGGGGGAEAGGGGGGGGVPETELTIR